MLLPAPDGLRRDDEGGTATGAAVRLSVAGSGTSGPTKIAMHQGAPPASETASPPARVQTAANTRESSVSPSSRTAPSPNRA